MDDDGRKTPFTKSFKLNQLNRVFNHFHFVCTHFDRSIVVICDSVLFIELDSG